MKDTENADFLYSRGSSAEHSAEAYAKRSDHVRADNSFMRAFGFYARAAKAYAVLGWIEAQMVAKEAAEACVERARKHRAIAKKEGR